MKPETILPDGADRAVINGQVVRKGSVAAFIASWKQYTDPALDDEARVTAMSDLLAMVPALEAVGVFDVFEIRDPALRALLPRAK